MGTAIKSLFLCAAASMCLTVAGTPASARRLSHRHHLVHRAVDPRLFTALFEAPASVPPKMMIMIGVGY